METDSVEEFACLIQSGPCRVVGFLTCDSEGVDKLVATLLVNVVTIEFVPCGFNQVDNKGLLLILCQIFTGGKTQFGNVFGIGGVYNAEVCRYGTANVGIVRSTSVGVCPVGH